MEGSYDTMTPEQLAAAISHYRQGGGFQSAVLSVLGAAALAAMGYPECQIKWASQKAGGTLDPPLEFFSEKATAAPAAMGNPECQIKRALQKAGGMLDTQTVPQRRDSEKR